MRVIVFDSCLLVKHLLRTVSAFVSVLCTHMFVYMSMYICSYMYTYVSFTTTLMLPYSTAQSV